MLFPYHQYLLTRRSTSSPGDASWQAADAFPATSSMNGEPRLASATRSPVRRLWDRLHRRRATSGAVTPASADRQHALDPDAHTQREVIARGTGLALVSGGYITDGAALFRIEHMHTDLTSGKAFIELEDCATMVLSVWPEEALVALPLRAVLPVASSGPAQASGIENELVGADPRAARR